MLFRALQLAYIGPGASELVVVALVLLMLFGSKDAPRIFRKMNQTLGRLRNTAERLKHEILYSDLKDEEQHRIGEELESEGALAAFQEDKGVSDADEGDDAEST